MEKFLKYFIKETNYKIDEIDFKSIRKNYGLNNFSHLFNTSDEKEWLVKIGYNHEKSIKNEIYFLKLYWPLTFFNGKNYFVKEMKKGFHVDGSFILKNLSDLKRDLDKFQVKQETLKVNYFLYCKDERETNQDFKIYRFLLKKHENSLIVQSHNDVNIKNLMHDGKEFFLIDFEWTKNNYQWFDIINFIREQNLNNNQIEKVIEIFDYLIDLDTVFEYLFINTYFAYTWAKSLIENDYQQEYLKIVKKQLNNLKTKIKRRLKWN